MNIFEIIILICLTELLYVFVLYPVLLRVLAVFFKKGAKSNPEYRPAIDVVMAAYNEEKLIEGAIRSIYEDKYPQELLKVWVVNDGSGDRTAEILANLQQEFSSLHVINLPRTGKNGALNEVIKRILGEVTVFMDADSRIIPGSIDAIVREFADAEVGAAIGEIIFDRKLENSGTQGESAYKVFERLLKENESAIHSVVTSHGPYYAVRRNFVTLIPNDKVCDDFLPLLNVALHGKRILYVPQAHIYEVREKDLRYEFGRIVRFTSGGLATVREAKKLVLPGARHSWFTFFLWSHKILRWLSPFFLVALLLASFGGAFTSTAVMALLIVQVVLYAMAFAGWIAEKRASGSSFLKLCYFFFVMNVSMMIGVYRFLQNSATAHWEPSNR